MLELDLYTDPGVMRAALAPYASAERVQVLHATRRAPRRDPASRACRIAVCYRMQSPGRPDQIVYGKVYPEEVCAERSANTEDAPTWLRGIDMLLWRLPRDPGLPQLGALLDGQTELVRYRPEERATLRRGSRYAKTFHGNEGAELFQRFSAFSSYADSFEVATPIGYDAATRTFWQEGVEAAGLADIVTARNCTGMMARVAQTLATLHATEPRFGPRRSNAALAAGALKRSAKIGRCMPELQAPAGRVADAIAARVPADMAVVQIHGDFHLEQLRMRAERLVLFDLDELAIGDPLEDLASFVVKCPLRDAQLARSACEALIEAYARAWAGRFNQERLDWHLAVQWLHKASRAYVWQRPGWRKAAEEALAEAERSCTP